MRDVTGDFRAVPNGLFQKRIARIARNCPFRHHYFFFFNDFEMGEVRPCLHRVEGHACPEVAPLESSSVQEYETECDFTGCENRDQRPV
jgi:hypothetical protein